MPSISAGGGGPSSAGSSLSGSAFGFGSGWTVSTGNSKANGAGGIDPLYLLAGAALFLLLWKRIR